MSENMGGEKSQQTHRTRGRGDGSNGNPTQNFLHPEAPREEELTVSSLP
ncbi:MAG: hypothetical protein F6K41_25025 [Symploca sp. SIO3E6]|nr:hypothetical protein [Caldora sp. SIO3E6]